METIPYRGRYTSAIETFNESTGSAEDAAAVELVLRFPDGTESSPMTPDHLTGSGLYSKTFIGATTAQLGLHKVIWTVTGSAGVAGGTYVDTFIVSSV